MELIKLTTGEFSKLAKHIYEQTGIHLPDSKLTLLSNRLRQRLRALKLESFEQYYQLIRDPKHCKDELPHFLSAVTTNETYFFRNDKLWKFFRETWIPEMIEKSRSKAKKTIRIWSAASSSGEEAYTAAICLRESLPNIAAWNVKIVGSDISDRVLERARAAEYNDYAVSRISEEDRKKWFDKKDDTFLMKKRYRDMVSFQFQNLRDPFPLSSFDLVFLRNVLMYFDTPMKLRVLENVTNALSPGGLLFVGDVDPIRNTPELVDALSLECGPPSLYFKPKDAVVQSVGS